MPGGFTNSGAREGYQTVDEEVGGAPNHKKAPSGPPPSAAAAHTIPPAAPGAYQTA